MGAALSEWLVVLPPGLAAITRSLGLEGGVLRLEDFLLVVSEDLHATKLLRNEDGSMFRDKDGKTLLVPDYPVRLTAVRVAYCLFGMLGD